MRLLDRYLFRELLAPLAYCLGGFLTFWISFDAFKSLSEFQDDKLHLADVVEYYLAMMPELIVTVLPIALLLALLYALTHHARHNEITAMRAAGISLWRVCLPYLAVGLLAGIALFVLNEVCVPHSTVWVRHILNRHAQRREDLEAQNRFTDFVNAREHRSWHFSEYHVKTTEMFNPIVIWNLPDGSLRQLKADRAIHTNGVWTFFGAKEFAQVNTNAPLLPSLQAGYLPMPEFDETPKQILSEIRINNYQGVRTLQQTDIPLADLVAYLGLHPDLTRADASRLRTELHARLAAPWTCLVVVLIAIPFGTVSGRRNLFVGVAGSIFICFAYLVIQKVSLALGSTGHLPPWLAAWLPNLVFSAIGLWMTARVR